MDFHGLLNVFKPAGITSFQVVRLVRRWSRVQAVGHGGTLDPLAEGVLPIALGQATRVLEFFPDSVKRYRARIRLGITTDTYDAAGRVTSEEETSSLGPEQIEAALERFRGSLQQVPPMYSALKQGGKRLYQLARLGQEVPRPPRLVEVFHLELSAWQPPSFTLEIVCSRGTYVRSLAHDLGQALGCGAHVSDLLRLQDGPFHVEDSISLPDLEQAFRDGTVMPLLYPLDEPLLHWKAAILGPQKVEQVRHGRLLTLGHSGELPPDGGRCRAYSVDGDFIALLSYLPARGLWQPQKVFLPPEPDIR